MKKVFDFNVYVAEKGKFFIRKSNNKIVGERVIIKEGDSITNYKEKVYTKKSFMDYYKSIGKDERSIKFDWNRKHPDDKYEISISNPIFDMFLNLNKKIKENKGE